MKIIYCITAYPPSAGGAQTHFHEIAKRLNKHHSVQIICHWKETRTDWLRGVTCNAPGSSEYYQDGVKVHQLNFTLREKVAIVPWVLSYYATMGASVARISDVLFKRMDETFPQVDLIHAGRIGREFLVWAAYKLARKRNIPFVFTPFHHPKWSGARWRWYLKLYCQADAVMALTRAEKSILTGLGVEQERIYVIGHAPQLASISPQPGYFGTGGPVVLFLGQKYAYKGLEQLLRSMPKVWQVMPETRFAFIGPRTSWSRKRFRRVNDPRIIEKDKVTEKEKLDALADCTIFCLPSRQESFGGVFTEAWMMAKPVVGGNISAVAELIEDGQDGKLVSESPEELAEILLYLLQNPQKAKQMGEKGHQKVLNKYNWEKISAYQESIYKGLLCRKQPVRRFD